MTKMLLFVLCGLTVAPIVQSAVAMNETDPCSLAVEGETDKICEAFMDNVYATEIASPSFPVVLCHSPGMFA